MFTGKKISAFTAWVITVILIPSVSWGANAAPPASPVKLIFIHHSTGGNWLADPDGGPYGGLGIALRDNNYYVSATNYGWGPDGIGDRTDIPNWPEWFTGGSSSAILSSLYSETAQNFQDYGSWSRLATDPGGENTIILFKSCFPNSNLFGAPDDPPAAQPNDEFTVSNAKAVYNNLLTYFAGRQDKLFIVITAPPLLESAYPSDYQTAAERAANARAFNNWLINDWLDGYSHHNVGVFDYFNVLTHPDNHHRLVGGTIEHYTSPQSGNFAYYPSGDSHPNATGHQKAATEFIPLLNIFYNTWKGAPPAVVFGNIDGSVDGNVNLSDAITALKICSGLTPSGVVLAAEVDGDGRIGLSEAIYALQKTAGLRAGSSLVQPSDLQYLGAFRLPDAGDRPLTFAYGGNAMSFNPDGDPSNGDAHPGSLFVTGHDRLPYGDLPDGNQIAEIAIPVPVIDGNQEKLPAATFIQPFRNALSGQFTDMEEIPKVGMQYLNHPDTGPKIHVCWGQHLQPPDTASHGWIHANLSTPDFRGRWFIGNQNLNSVNGYMFDIPSAWADANVNSRYLATGRMRDGGQGGMGPALFAYRPWLSGGAAPASGAHLEETTLLLYENADSTEDIVRCLDGYQHADEWEGGAWITTPSGKSALLFAGTKATGGKYWYGFRNPGGAALPCVDAHISDFTTCRNADGSRCPDGDFSGCCDDSQGNCISNRGWWSTRFDAQLILYDPADLAQVAAGTMESWEPQPYARIDIDEHLYFNPSGSDIIMIGEGDQRRYRIGAAAYDRNSGFLYVLELFVSEGKPVVHVWKIS